MIIFHKGQYNDITPNPLEKKYYAVKLGHKVLSEFKCQLYHQICKQQEIKIIYLIFSLNIKDNFAGIKIVHTVDHLKEQDPMALINNLC